ncbi:MAG: multidrug effflux MFS transporter [Flavobacteriales bacterium]|nr:multidrug effflux MFS transporter [Flavobacteriales bacterium]
MSRSRIDIPSYFLPFFGMVAAIVPFAIDAYLPAIPTMAEQFGVDTVSMNNTISIFLIGYGLGQFFGGPLSDQVGRKTIGLTGMLIFMASTIGIIFTETVESLMVFRGIQAIGGGFTSVIIMASMRDVYPAHEAGRKYAVVMMIMLVMPMIAPFIGAYLLPFGWRMIFIALLAFVLLAAVWYFFGLKETAHSLSGRVDIRRIADQFIEVVSRRTDEKMPVIAYVFAMSFNVGLLLAFVTNSSDIYQGYFGVDPKAFPFFFGANTILMIGCIFYSMRMMKTVHPHTLFIRGNLIQLTCATLTLCYVLFFQPELYVMFGLIILCVGTMGLANPCASAVYISYYDELSGSATSFSSLILLFMGGLVGALVGFFKNDTLIPFAVSMFVCALVSNAISLNMPKPQGHFKKE